MDPNRASPPRKSLSEILALGFEPHLEVAAFIHF